ncbi:MULTISPECIES: autotransporter outer membrane beta-barrel domain-containing protein [unclassified Pseudomonas]|uniref:autotransporter family protein n=1 Tax=unclassified Pseudomonas TaxID=196821 RepID=UPI000839255B|nr:MULTISPECIES: autotransporter outer membrane beta-barrel domain-containing protein [unclassified Pseudomonas]QIH05258.1 autotransporter outer membrane beta-barrel domain-containing protein [Pseudomonas sp. BIOMIG1BAC]
MFFARHRLALSIALTIASGLTAPVQAELLIDSPVTQTPKPDYDQKVTVTNTGSITVSGTALDLNNQYRSYWWNIENSGQITSTQGRAIDLGIPGSNNTWYGSYTLRNNPDGQIQGAEDAIRISNQPSGGAPINIQNSGTITSLNGAGINLSGYNTLHYQTAVTNQKDGVIQSSHADAIIMDSGTNGQIYNLGEISGGRNGVTIGKDVRISNKGAITGHDGTGVFSEAHADVYNYIGGVISGGTSGSLSNADGDGIRLDKGGSIWNEGTIQGTAASGVNKYGRANTSEGISSGGGLTLSNYGYPKTVDRPIGVISGANNGVLIDDGNGGSALAASRVYNYGIIQGLDGFGVKFVGDFNDEVINGGLISGSNGVALDMGGGDDILRLQSGSRFEGLVDGGSGHNTLVMGESYSYGDGNFGDSRNFQVLEVRQGQWTLTGKGDFNEGAHVFRYATLTNQGGIAGDVLVDQNAQYRGSGTSGNLTVNGTLQTSKELGGPQVNGNLVMGSGSTWVASPHATGGVGTVRVSGNANLSGASLLITPDYGNPNPWQNQFPWHSQYRLLEAGSITGTFKSDLLLGYAFLDPVLTYGQNTVDLSLTRNSVSFTEYARTANGARAVEAIDSIGWRDWRGWPRDPVFGPWFPRPYIENSVYNALLLTSESSAGLAIEKLAGSGNANLGIATLNASSQVGSSMLATMRQLGSGAGLLAGLDPTQTPTLAANSVPGSARNLNDPNARGRVWLQALGGYGKLDGEHGNPGLEQRTSGSVLGVDWSLSSAWRLGILGGYSKTDLSNRDLDGKLHSWHIGAYAMRQDGPLALRLGAAYSRHDGDNKRSVEFDRFSDRPKGSYDASSQQAFVELGYTLGSGRLNVEPFANLGYQRYHRDRYTEKGGPASLIVNEQNQDNFSSTFGVRLAHLQQLQNGISLTPRASLGWRHTYGELESDTSQSFVLGSDDFKVEGSALDRDSLMVEAGLDIGLSARHTLSVGYNGEFGSNSRNHGWMGQWQMSF